MNEESTAESPGMSRIPPPQQVRPLRPPSSPSDLLKPVTRRGRLVPAVQPGGLDLLTENGRFELLGSFEFEASEGDDVEIVGVPAPTRSPVAIPAILVRQLRRLE
jgi:hypothetical protein